MIKKQIAFHSTEIEEMYTLYQQAFPKNEQMDLTRLFDELHLGAIYGYYQENQLVGFAILCIQSQIAHILYLAVKKEYRDQGIGSYILNDLAKQYDSKKIIVDIEKIKDTSNKEQRIKRKQFYLKNDKQNNRFLELIKDIPVNVLNVTDEIIDFARKGLDKELNDGIYITLTDHINYAIERYLQGINVQNPLLWEIRQFYQEEYKIAAEALKIINQKLMVNLSEDEVGFIALHFVNAELNSEMEEVTQITKIIQEILNIVRYHLKRSL